VAAMNPCPCGYLGHPDKPCKDSEMQVVRYRGKISGPLWDRIDMHIEVPALRYRDINQAQEGESSAAIRAKVKQARERQQKRFGSVKTNARMTTRDLKKYVILDQESQKVLQQAIDVMGMSARGCDRILKVALTIADLAGDAKVEAAHLMEAINFRK
jgi:magnesium chelatase family protein